MSLSSEFCVLSGTGLCDGLIPRPGELYRVCVCMSLSVTKLNSNPLHFQWGRLKEVRIIHE
jgi:hypothetical protein